MHRRSGADLGVVFRQLGSEIEALFQIRMRQTLERIRAIAEGARA